MRAEGEWNFCKLNNLGQISAILVKFLLKNFILSSVNFSFFKRYKTENKRVYTVLSTNRFRLSRLFVFRLPFRLIPKNSRLTVSFKRKRNCATLIFRSNFVHFTEFLSQKYLPALNLNISILIRGVLSRYRAKMRYAISEKRYAQKRDKCDNDTIPSPVMYYLDRSIYCMFCIHLFIYASFGLRTAGSTAQGGAAVTALLVG